MVEERVLTRLSRVAFNRYPNEEYDQLCEQIAAHFVHMGEQIVVYEFFHNCISFPRDYYLD